MYQKILVPLDGSELSASVLEHVKAVATGCSVPEVVLLMVVEPMHGQVYGVSDEWLNDSEKKAMTWAKDYLDKQADELQKEGIAASTAVVQGRPDDRILDYADKNQVDLIIMSTHGRSGISRWVSGSVADRVIRHSTVPVFIVPPRARKTG